jgi:hypothetical protein
VAGLLLPESRQRLLDLMGYGVALAELALAAFLLRKVLLLRKEYRQRAAGDVDVYTALRASARELLGETAGTLLPGGAT